MRIDRFAALLVLAAGVGADTGHDQWVREIRELWDAARRVPVDDSVDARGQYGPKVLPSERGRYKVEFPGGRVVCTDQAPPGTAGVRAVWQRTPAPPRPYKVGGSDAGPEEFWVRVSWIAEKRRWESGSARDVRTSADDRNYRAWMSRVGHGRHMHGTGVRTWSVSHGYLVKELSTLRSARDALSRKEDAATLERVRNSEQACATSRAKLEQGLLAAGERLGVGDAMWRCEKATLELAEARSAEKAAKAAVTKWRMLARDKPHLAENAATAQRAWEDAGKRANQCRRDRREAMEAVMKGIY